MTTTNCLLPDNRMVPMYFLKLIIGGFKHDLSIEEREELDRWISCDNLNMELYDDILEACWPFLKACVRY